jgi:hypothetical protein
VTDPEVQRIRTYDPAWRVTAWQLHDLLSVTPKLNVLFIAVQIAIPVMVTHA